MNKTNKTPRPNFLIVGAAKSGTTSLYHYLRQHPDVFMPDWKEPSFFAPLGARGVTYEADYLALFEDAKHEKAIGEASVAYLYAPETPKQISEFLGRDVKIVMVLRNPVDMIYSFWGHNVREGIEDLSFSEALDAENERLAADTTGRFNHSWVGNIAYVGRAAYMEQIERYDRVFPRENIKIFIYEEFFKPGLPLFPELCGFLQIDTGFKPDTSKKHNVAGQVRSVLLRELIRNPATWKEPIKAVVPADVRLSIKEALERLNRRDVEMPELDPALRKHLQARFDPVVRALEQRLQRDLSKVWF